MKNEEIGFGIRFDLEDPVATQFLSEKPIIMRDAYRLDIKPEHMKEVNTIMKRILLSGYKKGSTISKIAEQLKQDLLTFVNITNDQALAISRTEIIGAANYGRYVSIKNSGFTKKKWITARDNIVRPLHNEMENKIINVDDVWVFSDGSTLRYPGDHEGPDHLIVNCRCVEVVVPGSHELLIG